MLGLAPVVGTVSNNMLTLGMLEHPSKALFPIVLKLAGMLKALVMPVQFLKAFALMLVKPAPKVTPLMPVPIKALSPIPVTPAPMVNVPLRPAQFSKAFAPMLVTFAPIVKLVILEFLKAPAPILPLFMVTLLSFVQLLKTFPSMEVSIKPDPMVTVSRLAHEEKADDPMLVTLSGMFRVTIFVLEKAFDPMVLTPAVMVRLSRALQPEKAPFPTPLTDVGMVTLSSLTQSEKA
jgi:hypothetical protein